MKHNLCLTVSALLVGFILFSCTAKEPPVFIEIPVQAEKEKPEEHIVQAPPEKSRFEELMEIALSMKEKGRVKAALSAYNKALAEADEIQKAAVMPDIKRLFSIADTRLLEELLMSETTLFHNSMILYRLGLNYAVEGQYKKADYMLSQFAEAFPDHTDYQDAKELIRLIRDSAFKKTTLGCLLPLSGRYSIFGQKALRGIELAVRDLSKEVAEPITIFIKDTASDNEKAVMAIDELNEQKVAAIAGPIITAGAAGKKAEELGIPLMALTQKNHLAERGAYLFSNFLTPEMQADALASYGLYHLGVTKFAILYPEDRYGKRYMNLFWDRVKALGGEIVGAESYQPGTTDFSNAIKKLTGLYYPMPDFLKTAKAYEKQLLDDFNVGTSDQNYFDPIAYDLDYQSYDADAGREEEEEEPIVDFSAIFIPDSPKTISLILPQLVYNDVTDLYLLGTNLWHDENLVKDAKGYVKKAVITDGFFSNSRHETTRRFADSFSSLYHLEAGFIEAAAYDTVSILIKSALDPAIESRAALRDALAGKNLFNGVTGPTLFDENGNADKELFYLTVKRGKFVEIKR